MTTNGNSGKSPRFATFPCQEAIIRWLPVASRVRLARSAPRIRALERRLPLEIHSLRFRYNRNPDDGERLPGHITHPTYLLYVDGLECEVKQAEETRDEREVRFSCGWSGRVLQVRTPWKIPKLIEFLLNFFLGRPGTRIKHLTTDDTIVTKFGQMKAFPLKASLSARCSINWDNSSPIHAVLSIDAPRIELDSPFHVVMVDHALEKFQSSRRRIGSLVAAPFRYSQSGMLSYGDYKCPVGVLKRVLRDTKHLNPQTGLHPNDDAVPCVFFQMDHADFCIWLCDDGMTVLMEVVTSGAVPKCEPENWPMLSLLERLVNWRQWLIEQF